MLTAILLILIFLLILGILFGFISWKVIMAIWAAASPYVIALFTGTKVAAVVSSPSGAATVVGTEATLAGIDAFAQTDQGKALIKEMQDMATKAAISVQQAASNAGAYMQTTVDHDGEAMIQSAFQITQQLRAAGFVETADDMLNSIKAHYSKTPDGKTVPPTPTVTPTAAPATPAAAAVGELMKAQQLVSAVTGLVTQPAAPAQPQQVQQSLAPQQPLQPQQVQQILAAGA